MYLKQLEIQGFKSFADRTRLTFEPGMIAIVGPNGCGKSNVSDAIRWVLGEQRPSALRCSKMQDLIFNGTDARKPVGMAEVSLLFSDCEKVLGTDYNEVTITRRIHRSGENLYFLNKVHCRLKDIQRLFMGTGVGTTSYSVLAQGQIDAILSSRPEDRRVIFEEAAGITKFKADRKEALRKIDQTEANLTRLADIIREVKRQIGVLQRQAEKAERYIIFRKELQALDVAITVMRIRALETHIADTALALADRQGTIATTQRAIEVLAETITVIEAKMREEEDALNILTEQSAQSAARHTRAGEIIRTNAQRIQEYGLWLERDVSELEVLRQQLEEQHVSTDESQSPDDAFEDRVETAQSTLEDAQEAFEDHQASLDDTRQKVQRERTAQLDAEQKVLFYQTKMAELEARQREEIVHRRELTLRCEDAIAHRTGSEEAYADAEIAHTNALQTAEDTREALIAIDEDRSYLGGDMHTLQAERTRGTTALAALSAQMELLQTPVDDEQPTAVSLVLNPANSFDFSSGDICGTLADALTVSPDAPKALQSLLAPWSRAVIVRNAHIATTLAEHLSETAPTLAIDLLVQTATPPTSIDTEPSPYEAYVRTSPDNVPLLRRLLAGMTPIDASTYRTQAGDIRRHPGEDASDPIARQMRVSQLQATVDTTQERMSALDSQMANLQARIEAMTSQWNHAKHLFEKAQREQAQTEALFALAKRNVIQARSDAQHRIDALAALTAATQGATHDGEAFATALSELDTLRHTSTATQAVLNQELARLEAASSVYSARLTEARIQCAGLNQQRAHYQQQQLARQMRIDQITLTVTTREASIQTYQNAIAKLEAENTALRETLDPMQQQTDEIQIRIEAIRETRRTLDLQREETHTQVRTHTTTIETQQEACRSFEVSLAEARFHHQNHLARMTATYSLTPETLPPPETLLPMPEAETDARIAELNQMIDALGPVNLLAIDEFNTLEERNTFLQTQYDDLTQSKEQILELIRTINNESGRLFRDTFNQANINFATMFKRLFHGGEVRLILLENPEDPLECGIDIIARPPGKKPQTISLLSGGERTMTAVALLFAIFLIKPAPFCMLDELDAALDDSNIGRFVEVLKDFLVHSQFLIITHNQHTIAGSDIIYGVTMPEKGISKTLSMRLGE